MSEKRIAAWADGVCKTCGAYTHSCKCEHPKSAFDDLFVRRETVSASRTHEERALWLADKLVGDYGSEAAQLLRYFATRPSAAATTPPTSGRSEEAVAKDALNLFFEYRDKHGHGEEGAVAAVLNEFADAAHFAAPQGQVVDGPASPGQPAVAAPEICRSAGANGEGKCRYWCGLNYCTPSAKAVSASERGERSTAAPSSHWVYDAAEQHRELVRACQDATSTDPVKAGHLWSMLDQIAKRDMSPTKACRWLGWVQACLCWYGVATLEELKEINRRASLSATEFSAKEKG